MCCSNNKCAKSTTSQKTTIFTREQMLQKAENNEKAEALFFEYGSLKFCIIYTKEYFKNAGLSHLGFYAMSRGFEAYTETGYKSNFAHGGESVGHADVEEFIKLKLHEYGIDLDNPKPCILSNVGGIVNLEQPSLF